LYNAKLHPEQYSDTFSSTQLKQLHKSILYVCNTAVDLLADSSKFPEEWLFKHRWGKGKKDSVTALPNGAKITFLTVGGRTSCVVPSVQKKTGAVAGDVKEIDGEAENGEEQPATKKGGRSNGIKKRKNVPKAEEFEIKDQANGTTKKRKAANDSNSKTSKVKYEAVEAPSEGRRRSGRASKKV
jgi:formamidopyrimidine-DNA glycosylase